MSEETRSDSGDDFDNYDSGEFADEDENGSEEYREEGNKYEANENNKGQEGRNENKKSSLEKKVVSLAEKKKERTERNSSQEVEVADLETLEQLVAEGKINGLDEESLQTLYAKLQSYHAVHGHGGHDSKGKSPKWSRSLREWIDEVTYVIKGFLKTGDSRSDDPYHALEHIDGPVVVFLSGLFGWPYNLKEFEHASELPLVHFHSHNVDQIHEFLTHVYDTKRIKPIVLGFSDGGGIRLHEYVEKYGDEAMAFWVSVAANKNVHSKKGIYIDGSSDCLAPWWKEYHTSTSVPLHQVPATHAGLIENHAAAKDIGRIIKDTAFTRYGVQLGHVYTDMYRKAA